MTDRVDASTRSRIMSRVKSRNTALEMRFRRELWAAGIRGYRCHRPDIFGVPDLAWVGLRVAVFVDSAWWHGHPSRWRPGRLPAHWDDKIRGNALRDKKVTSHLLGQGWRVVRIWDFEINDCTPVATERVLDAVEDARRSDPRKGFRPRRRPAGTGDAATARSGAVEIVLSGAHR